MIDYLNDTLLILISRAEEHLSGRRTELEIGILQGYYESISILLNQACSFQLYEDLRPEIQEYKLENLIQPF